MNINRFITVTISPFLERTLVTKFLAVGYQNKTVEPERLDPSGQGVDITRALYSIECESHAVVLLGKDLTGYAFRALLAEEDFEFTSIDVEGPTPSRTCILDTGHDQETFITTESASLAESDIQQLANTLRAMVNAEDMVIFAGSLPASAPQDSYARLIDVVHAAGAQAVLITEGDALGEALVTKPEMVALSQIQCEAFFNVPVRVEEDLLTMAHKLRQQGVSRVLLEMQETGSALLVSEEGQWRVDLPETPDAMEGTTSGIWEALLAGFLAGHCQEIPLDKALEMAGAAAAYAADEVGVKFGSPQDVQKYRENVEVHLAGSPKEAQSVEHSDIDKS